MAVHAETRELEPSEAGLEGDPDTPDALPTARVELNAVPTGAVGESEPPEANFDGLDALAEADEPDATIRDEPDVYADADVPDTIRDGPDALAETDLEGTTTPEDTFELRLLAVHADTREVDPSEPGLDEADALPDGRTDIGWEDDPGAMEVPAPDFDG